jgi:hypothetical protein
VHVFTPGHLRAFARNPHLPAIYPLESNTNDEQRRARGQRVTEVAWENAGSNRGLDLSLEKKIDGGGRVDAGAHEDRN